MGKLVRNEVVCALTGKLPIDVHVQRAMARHVQSLADHPRRATEFYKWANEVESGERPDCARYKGHTAFGKLARFASHQEGLGGGE